MSLAASASSPGTRSPCGAVWMKHGGLGDTSGNTAPAHPDLTKDRSPEDPAVLVCTTCALVLAQVRDRVAIDGRTVHERVNYAGYPHRFMTVRRCTNVDAVSPPSTDFSWFEGYAWEIIACAGCRSHVGWRWQGEGEFLGLLLHAVEERGSSEGTAHRP